MAVATVHHCGFSTMVRRRREVPAVLPLGVLLDSRIYNTFLRRNLIGQRASCREHARQVQLRDLSHAWCRDDRRVCPVEKPSRTVVSISGAGHGAASVDVPPDRASGDSSRQEDRKLALGAARPDFAIGL